MTPCGRVNSEEASSPAVAMVDLVAAYRDAGACSSVGRP